MALPQEGGNLNMLPRIKGPGEELSQTTTIVREKKGGTEPQPERGGGNRDSFKKSGRKEKKRTLGSVKGSNQVGTRGESMKKES